MSGLKVATTTGRYIIIIIIHNHWPISCHLAPTGQSDATWPTLANKLLLTHLKQNLHLSAPIFLQFKVAESDRAEEGSSRFIFHLHLLHLVHPHLLLHLQFSSSPYFPSSSLLFLSPGQEALHHVPVGDAVVARQPAADSCSIFSRVGERGGGGEWQ